MLSSSNDSVAQIASKVGYDSEQAFNHAFKRNFVRLASTLQKREKSAKQAAGTLADGMRQLDS